MLTIERIDHFGFPIMRLEGRLDLATFRPLLHELASLQPQVTVGLDLTDLLEMDAAGAALLETTSEWLEVHGGRLRILGCSPAARRELGSFCSDCGPSGLVA